MNYAVLSNEDNFTVFRYGDYVIRFRAPYSLERYTAVKECMHVHVSNGKLTESGSAKFFVKKDGDVLVKNK